MIRKVGDCAGKQAAKLLTACGEEIEKHFSENLGCRTTITTRPSTMEKYWEVEVKLGRSGSRKSARIRWIAGALVCEANGDPDPALVLYIWACGSNGQGGRQAEEDLARLLGQDRVKGRSAEMDLSTGLVAFGIIPLRDKDSETFDIEEDVLLQEIRDSLKAVGKKDIDALLRI
jgi:hypothetical protein